MPFDRDQEEEEVLREQAAEHAATSNTIKCGALTLRKMSMATYVMLDGTRNIFVAGESRKRNAMFDAAAFVWMHAAPEADVFSTDWQDPRELSAVVTAWMSQFRGSELVEFAKVAAAERDRYMASEFKIKPSDLGPAEKKSRRGQSARSGTRRT